MQRFWGDVIAAVCFIGLSGWIMWYSHDFRPGAKFFEFCSHQHRRDVHTRDRQSRAQQRVRDEKTH